MSKVFSLPINPKFDPEFIETTFVSFLKKHEHLIFDLYFPCRMPPFTQDAMGDVFVSGDDQVIEMALWISQETGIDLSQEELEGVAGGNMKDCYTNTSLCCAAGPC